MEFECKRCTFCCHNYHVQKIYPEDLERWKDRVDILEYFLQDWYDLPCKFLEGDVCTIHDIKPQVCRDQPFNELGYRTTCPGIKHGSKKET
jgi:Fe-S-cluster containining protein